jgi:hypothetical protein
MKTTVHIQAGSSATNIESIFAVFSYAIDSDKLMLTEINKANDTARDSHWK